MTPIVAIVGRPNVGKSTLFNRLIGRSLAIVDDEPGVTRDRHYASSHLRGRELTLVDTGGLDPDGEDPMGRSIARQVEIAVAEADVILCVLDGTAPATPADREAIAWLRKSGKLVFYVANKVDGAGRDNEALGLYELGFERLVRVSALHGRGLAELEALIAESLPGGKRPLGEKIPVNPKQENRSDSTTEPQLTQVPHVAIIGRPNVGKSSLFNRLAGSERSLIDARPGTTRDPVDTSVKFRGKPYVLVDTAGIRRRSRVERGVEAVSVLRAIRAVERAEVVILLADASAGVSEQDARLLGLCSERHRAIVVGLNKIDLLAGAGRQRSKQAAREALAFAPWVPIVGVSAHTGVGLDELMRKVSQAAHEFHRRVSTGELNRFFEQIIVRQPPPTSGGRAPRLFYITQAETAPPVFVAMSSAPQAIAESYRRFVANQIRRSFGFESVPVLVRYRSRRRRTG